MEKRFFKLADFPQLEGVAADYKKPLSPELWENPLSGFQKKEIQVTCPECGSSRCFVQTATGVFHCWPCGCSGMIEEFKDKGQSNKTKLAIPVSKKDDGVAMIPDDYKAVSEDVLKKCKLVYEAQSFTPSGLPCFDEGQILVQKYLQSIGISQETAECQGLMCGVFAVKHKDSNETTNDPCLVYPNRIEGRIINLKMRSVKLDSLGNYMKAFTQESPTKPLAPYAIYSAIEYEGVRVITEGEHDQLTLFECGFHGAISVPSGAGASEEKIEPMLEAFRDWLEGEEIIICGDSDHAGRGLTQRLLKYFNYHAKIVTLPSGYKDISEVYRDLGREEVIRLMNEAKVPDNPHILRINDFRDDIMDVLRGNYDHGYSLGFGPYTDRHFKLTGDGGLIVVTGTPGSGKTDLMRCLTGRLMTSLDKHVALVSFEEPNKKMQVRRMIELIFGDRHTEQIPDGMLYDCLDYLQSHMAHIPMNGLPTTPRNIIAQCEWLREEGFPIEFLYVDPYLFIQNEYPRDSETQQIQKVLNEFQSWGRENHIWVILVAHPRKLVKDGMGEYEEVDAYSISGSAHWANMADYLMSVKRVFPGGKDVDAGSEAPSYTQVDVLKVRDQSICNTGRMYFLRQPNGRYEERSDEGACKTDLTNPYVQYIDTESWLP